MCYFTHLSTEQHKVWNYTSGVKTLPCLQSRAPRSSQTVPLKKLSGGWQSRSKLWACTAVQLSSYCGESSAQPLAGGASLAPSITQGMKRILPAKTYLSHRQAKIWFNFLIVSGKGKSLTLLKGGLISTLIFSVEGLKSVTTSDPSGAQSPREDLLFQLDSMWNQTQLLQYL